jgi:P4 family phage/plasmid primase-like protien
MRSEVNKLLYDIKEIQRGLSIFSDPEDIIEVRALDAGRPGLTKIGFFSDHDKTAKAIASLSGNSMGVYIIPNLIDPLLLNRSANLIKNAGRNDGTSDSNIIKRRWLLVDFDAKRLSGISSTDAEHQLALDKAKEAAEYLIEKLGFSPKSIIAADSGNGAHLNIKIDVPLDKDTDKLIENCLKAMAFLFSTPQVDVDLKVFNRARIWKAYGSMACKGSDMPDRPHRLAQIIYSPPEIVPATLETLQKLAELMPEEPKPVRPVSTSPRQYGEKLDLAKWLPDHNINIRKVSTWENWQKYEPECCPFDSNHTGSSVAFLQNDDGAIKFRCEHNSCNGRTWADVRLLKEPDRTALQPRPQPVPPAPPQHNTPPPVEYRLRRMYPRSDTGNAELFRDLYARDLKFDHRREHWLQWNSHHFIPDIDGQLVRYGIEAARRRFDNAWHNDVLDEETKKKEAGWALSSEAKGKIDAFLSIASNLEPITDSGDQWDWDDLLFGVPNGVIDLRTGKLRAGTPDDKVTKQSPIIFDDKAKAPRWEKFLREIFCDDEKLISWIQMACGYSLTGITKEQSLFICYGAGANGKSKFLALLRYVLGDYAFDAPFSTFEAHLNTSVPNDLASLENKRLVTSSETNDGTRLNEARLKSITGGDPITARYLHQEFFTFAPKLKLWLAVNYLPLIRDNSLGFWRRVRTIPFERTFSGDTDDKDIFEKLVAEGPGILNWFIDGCLRWQKEGLFNLPEPIKDANKEYKDDSNLLFAFIGDSIVPREGTKISATELYKAYKHWAFTAGLMDKELLTSTAFGKIMGKQFKRITVHGVRFYQNIAIADAPIQGTLTPPVTIENEQAEMVENPGQVDSFSGSQVSDANF